MKIINFWSHLFDEGAVIGMSPMDGVTDAAMRYMTAKYGNAENLKPKSEIINSRREQAGVEVIFTEFVSVDALWHAKQPEAVDRLMRAFIKARDVGELVHKPYEVAQVFGNEPELFYQAAVIVAELGFDGLDINMGCPAKNVSERGSGAGLIRTPAIAKEIVRAAKRGVRDWAEGKVSVEDLEVSTAVNLWVAKHKIINPKFEKLNKAEILNLKRERIPVSVKTRIGVESDVSMWWMEQLMEVEPAVISLHGRTLKQLYQGQADWEAIGRAAEVVHQLGGRILGNGDIDSVASGMLRVERYGVDGFLIGRAAEGNPGVFTGNEPSWETRKAWMIEHAEIYERVFGKDYFVPMRKHLAWYCKGFPGASEMREKLVRANSVCDLSQVLM